ncbi:hypothetical protein K501DRAFT_267753 [Backusella circina FSU 941]|nr:hypothetical protein K501DRAFT_267753 [Backusella circina FSU 941]
MNRSCITTQELSNIFAMDKVHIVYCYAHYVILLELSLLLLTNWKRVCNSRLKYQFNLNAGLPACLYCCSARIISLLDNLATCGGDRHAVKSTITLIVYGSTICGLITPEPMG